MEIFSKDGSLCIATDNDNELFKTTHYDDTMNTVCLFLHF